MAFLLTAALLASAAGAAIGPLSVWALTGHWSALSAAAWLVRNTVSVVLILAAGPRIGHLLDHRARTRARSGARTLARVVGAVAADRDKNVPVGVGGLAAPEDKPGEQALSFIRPRGLRLVKLVAALMVYVLVGA